MVWSVIQLTSFLSAGQKSSLLIQGTKSNTVAHPKQTQLSYISYKTTKMERLKRITEEKYSKHNLP